MPCSIWLHRESERRFDRRRRRQRARAHHGLGGLAQARTHWEQALGLFAAFGTPEAAQLRTRLTTPADDHIDHHTPARSPH